jgi:hypothetical protein
MNVIKSACSTLVQQLATICLIDWLRPRFSKAGKFFQRRDKVGAAAGFHAIGGQFLNIVSDVGCPLVGEKMATITAGLMMSYYCRGYHGHALYAAVRMPIDLGGGNLCTAEFLIQGFCKEGSFACVGNLFWKLQCLGLSETEHDIRLAHVILLYLSQEGQKKKNKTSPNVASWARMEAER